MYNNSSKETIIVCCHKKDIMATKKPYFPLHVGKALTHLELGITPDNTGINISDKNTCYCELTGIYWAWKNLKDVKIIGLNHYRRYFDFHNQCQLIKPYTIFPTSTFKTIDLTIPNHILDDILNGTIILPRKENYHTSVLTQYNNSHSSIDMNIIRNIIKDNFEDKYSKAIWDVLVMNNKISLCNMFIMNWIDFDNYCTWLFEILKKAENKVDINNYSDYQKRLFGFLAERLLNVWVYAEHKRTKTYPIIYFSDNQDKISKIPVINYSIGCLINNMMNLLRKIEFKFKLIP